VGRRPVRRPYLWFNYITRMLVQETAILILTTTGMRSPSTGWHARPIDPGRFPGLSPGGSRSTGGDRF
jgi:hypothetical protein